jgi:hypothetical protein
MDKPNANYLRRYRRKKLLQEIREELEQYDVRSAYAHTHFVLAEEKRPKNITIYVEFATPSDKTLANRADMSMDSKFKRKKINIIDIASLQPAIRDFVFGDLTRLF